jgi:hypothetical protein
VVKAALQLLHRMVHQGIFQPPLRPQVYLNTLRKAEEELELLQPKRQEDEEEGEGGEEAGEDGAQWKPIQVRQGSSACSYACSTTDVMSNSTADAGLISMALVHRLLCCACKNGKSA